VQPSTSDRPTNASDTIAEPRDSGTQALVLFLLRHTADFSGIMFPMWGDISGGLSRAGFVRESSRNRGMEQTPGCDARREQNIP
jgi:hypothetical protein